MNVLNDKQYKKTLKDHGCLIYRSGLTKWQLLSLIKAHGLWERDKYIRLNNKPIKYEKLLKIIQNNYNKNSKFRIRLVMSQQPFYKGDFIYFRNKYLSKGWNRVIKNKYYIDCLE